MKPYAKLHIFISLIFAFISCPIFAMRVQPTVDPELLELPAPVVNNFLNPTDVEQKKLKSARSSSPHPKPRVLASRERAKTPTQLDQPRPDMPPCSALQEARNRIEQDAPT